jgi:hypothetical protein
MVRPAFALALAATLLAAGPAMGAPGPSKPDLLPLPDTVTSLPLAIGWTPSTFTPDSLERHYEIELEDRTEGAKQLVTVPAAGGLGTVTASVMLVDGHTYRARVRALETICRPVVRRPASWSLGSTGTTSARGSSWRPSPLRRSRRPRRAPPASQPPTVAETPPVGAADPATPPAASAALTAALAPQVRLEVAPRLNSRPEPRPRPRWVAPALTRRLDPRSAIRLGWRENLLATFYNVQVFVGRRKVLSAWPTAASLTLRPGTMRPGICRIVVWSASGPKVAPIFDPLPWVVQVLRTGRPATIGA